MKNLNRRDLCVALSAFAAMGSVSAEAQTPMTPAQSGEKSLSTPQAFPFDSLQAKKTENGVTRPVIQGVLPTGEAVELHETKLPPRQMPQRERKQRHARL